MKQIINVKNLSEQEQRRLKQLADKVGMTVDQWIEYSQKAQIYHNAEERLGLVGAA